MTPTGRVHGSCRTKTTHKPRQIYFRSALAKTSDPANRLLNGSYLRLYGIRWHLLKQKCQKTENKRR